MAIQFECPHCSAVIRVPDDAAGKAGKCPQCKANLLVPQIDIPPTSEATSSRMDEKSSQVEAAPQPQPLQSPTGAESSGLPIPAAPTFDPAPSELDGETANDAQSDTPMFQTATQPSVARRYKRKRRRKSSGVLIPITFGSILVATIAFFYLQQTPDLVGKLTAELLDYPDLAPGMIDRDIVSLPDETIDLVLETLADDPERFDTSVVDMQLRGTTKGLEVAISPTRYTAFYRVNIKQNAGLMKYYDQHGREMSDFQARELQKAANDFFKLWSESIQEKIPVNPDDMLEFRDRIGFNSLVNGLGFQVIAVVKSKSYRCVHESDGFLYFMLPKNVAKFRIRGREMSDGKVLFPGNYEIKVVEKKSKAK